MAATLVYLNTLGDGFVWDDPISVASVRHVRGAGDAATLFARPAFAGVDSAIARAGLVEYYRPLWSLSLAVDHALWGDRASGYHLMNLVLHVAAAALTFAIALALLGDVVLALLAGLLFAVHPVHVEAVAWISARNELLCTVALLAAFLAYARERRGGKVFPGIVCVLAFEAALLSKETALAFPLLVLLYELRDRTATLRSRVVPPLILAAAAVPYLVMRAAVVHPLPDPHPLVERLMAAPAIALTYLRLLLVPHPLAVLYHADAGAGSLGVWLAALGLVIVVVLVARMRTRAPEVSFGLGWTLLTMVPVLGIAVTLRPAPLAERYLYLPSVGWCLAWAGAIALAQQLDAGTRADSARGARVRAWLLALSWVVLAAFTAMTVRRNAIWKSDATLMPQMAADAPGSPHAHEGLALVLEQQGRLAEALAEYRAARALDPTLASTTYNVARMHELLGDTGAAVREYRAALDLDPRYRASWYALGHLLESQAHFDEAATAYERGLELGPDAEARFGLGYVRHRQGRLEDAEHNYREAIRLRPNHPRAHLNLGGLFAQEGKLGEARTELERAVAFAPRNAEARYNLGEVLRMLHEDAAAERAYRAAIALDPAHASAHEGLGRLLLRMGREEEGRGLMRAAARLRGDSSATR